MGCKLGEPLIHGPHSYEFCSTHDRLMIACRFESEAKAANFIKSGGVSHSPLPWRVEVGGEPDDVIIVEPSGNTVCEPNTSAQIFADLDPSVHEISLEEGLANAEFIVRAVNAHDALVAALNGLKNFFRDSEPCWCPLNPLTELTTVEETGRHHPACAAATLALASPKEKQ